MALVTKAYKGSRDFYPEEMRLRSEVFARWRQVAESFAFEEYDGPFLEERALYEAKSGQELVSKQLYDFVDKGGRSVAIRPEMTPTFARMVAGKLGELPRPIRWYSIPNLWRYEKPQRGRLREHFQFNADIMGGEPFLADLEMLQLANSLLKNFDLNNEVEIRVNHRGLWQEILASVWGFGSSEQDEETKLKITKLIDASDKMDASVLIAKLSQLNLTSFQLEKISSFISEPISLEIVEDWCENSESENLKQSFQYLKELMAHFSNTSSVKFDPKIMRGLDYYTGIIFEAFDKDRSKNNRAVFGGGRYDNLMDLFGKEKISGVGLGMGDVGLVNLLETYGKTPELKKVCDVFVTLSSRESLPDMMEVSGFLRDQSYNVCLSANYSSLKSQLKSANRMKAKFALLLADTQGDDKIFAIKNLDTGEQVEVKKSGLFEKFSDLFKS